MRTFSARVFIELKNNPLFICTKLDQVAPDLLVFRAEPGILKSQQTSFQRIFPAMEQVLSWTVMDGIFSIFVKLDEIWPPPPQHPKSSRFHGHPAQ